MVSLILSWFVGGSGVWRARHAYSQGAKPPGLKVSRSHEEDFSIQLCESLTEILRNDLLSQQPANYHVDAPSALASAIINVSRQMLLLHKLTGRLAV